MHSGGRPGMDGTIEMAGRELKILEIWRENKDMISRDGEQTHITEIQQNNHFDQSIVAAIQTTTSRCTCFHVAVTERCHKHSISIIDY